jgi:hypothetical protein
VLIDLLNNFVVKTCKIQQNKLYMDRPPYTFTTCKNALLFFFPHASLVGTVNVFTHTTHEILQHRFTIECTNSNVQTIRWNASFPSTILAYVPHGQLRNVQHGDSSFRQPVLRIGISQFNIITLLCVASSKANKYPNRLVAQITLGISLNGRLHATLFLKPFSYGMWEQAT